MKDIKAHDPQSQFLINISHEFRTPINIILGSCQLVKLYLDKLTSQEDIKDKIETHIGIINNNSYKLLRLINNTIELSDIEFNNPSLNLQYYDIVDIVENTVDSVIKYTKKNNIEILFDTNIDEKVIACDSYIIYRILTILISNAIKYNKPNGNILVTLSYKKNFITLSVKDTGIGMEEDVLGFIFESFSQADNKLNRRYEGLGIGLSIVKSLVTLHKGTISVKSKKNIGSEFIIKIPSNLKPDKKNGMNFTVSFNKSIRDYIEMLDTNFSDI